MKCQTASKDHYCDLCHRKIPKGVRYWREYIEDGAGLPISNRKEHTNCELFRKEKLLPEFEEATYMGKPVRKILI